MSETNLLSPALSPAPSGREGEDCGAWHGLSTPPRMPRVFSLSSIRNGGEGRGEEARGCLPASEASNLSV